MMKAIIFDYNGVLNTAAEIKDVILQLSQDHQLFIASNSSLSNIQGFLQAQDCLQYFTEILAYDSGFSKFDKFKSLLRDYSLDPKDVIFITDTQGDIIQAQQAGLVHIIGLLGGWADRKTLAKANPEKIIDSLEELSHII